MPEAVPLLRVAVVGLGTIGRAVAKAVAEDKSMTLAGLIEVDASVGRTIRKVIGMPLDTAVTIGDDPEALQDVDVAIVCASPRFDRIAPTLRRLFNRNIPVVAGCAEMTWPWLRHPHLADVIAGEARAAGMAVVGGDVYPGFGWWRPLLSMPTDVRRVAIQRTAVVRGDRESVLRRCAMGRSIQQFTGLARQGYVGQSGLGEAVVAVAQRLGRHPMRGQIATTVLPLPADAVIDSPLGRIEAGHVAGVRQRAVYQDDDLDIEIELNVRLPPAESTTEWSYEGPSPLATATLDDERTSSAAAMLIDAARRVGRLPPGLRTVIDLQTITGNERWP